MGDGGSGKSALTRRFCLDVFEDEFDPTVEDVYRMQVVVDGENCVVQIKDTAGQCEQFERDRWVTENDGFVIVFSIISRA